jgi:glycosyltransferase involved in cell wall biosynthesis
MESRWVIVCGDFTRTGGMDRANYHLAWFLADRLGRRVDLVAFDVAQPLASHPNVRVHLASRPFGSHILGDFVLRRKGRQVAAAATNARVVVNGGNCAWPDINWVHHVHHAYESSARGAPWFFRLRNRLFLWHCRREERKALHVSRLLFANSEKTRTDLIDRLEISSDRVQVVYLGVDADEFGPISPQERAAARLHWQIGEDETMLAFIGALGYDDRKGFGTLLETICLLRERGNRSLRILAAGSGALAYWRQKIVERGIADQVRLLGPVSEVRNLLAATDLLVSPTYFEAYGLAVHEALCRGVPAIVTQTAGIAERFMGELHDLLLRDPTDAAELASRIGLWQSRTKDYSQAVNEFGAALRAWTWDDMAARIVECIETARTPMVPLAVECS